jgi:hypothetical protein
MNRSNYQSLLNRGRKAGLNTRELSSALAGQPVTGADGSPGQPDCNGSIWTIDEHGHRVYRMATAVVEEKQPEPPAAKAS